MSTITPHIHALIDYSDDYVQPLLLKALSVLPAESFTIIDSLASLPPGGSVLQIQQYELLPFESVVASPATHFINSYVIRKALIRKHYLSTTVAHWISKHPDSSLKRHVKPSVEFELDYAEFLDEALVEAYELKESWQRNEELSEEGKEWWILKPGMSERAQGIRLFSSEEELTGIFEEWEPDSEGEEEEDDEGEVGKVTSDQQETSVTKGDNDDRIMTSHLRHFIAQPYVHPPLLLPSSGMRKFHIRTYVLAVGALKVYVYQPMLALFAAEAYAPPWENAQDLRSHLTNTCIQGSSVREGSIQAFWDLKDQVNGNEAWKEDVFEQICQISGEIFEAAARGMTVHFQPLPNAFELFGVDFLVDAQGTTYLLEVNAFPDFRQTGDELQDLIGGLFEEVINVAVKPFFGMGEEASNGTKKMKKVLDIDLGRR